MYDFVRRPAWILNHVLIALLIMALVGLGLWQRQRWLEAQATSDRLARMATGPAVSLDTVVSPTTRPDAVDPAVEFRRVTVTGTYDAAAEVAIRSRSQEGLPGGWVMTPLVQADGTAVAVVRGWVPLDVNPPPPPFPGSVPPTGPVTVTGIVKLSQQRGPMGGTDPPGGTLRSLARVDLSRYGRQIGEPLAPVWVMLDSQDPPQPGGARALPQLVQLDLPAPTRNLSYMFQWWIFAAIAVIGYPLVLRRVARHRAGGQVPDDDVDDHPVPSGV